MFPLEPGDSLYDIMAKNGPKGMICIQAANAWFETYTDEQIEAFDQLPIEDKVVLTSYHLKGFAMNWDLINRADDPTQNKQIAERPEPNVDEPSEPEAVALPRRNHQRSNSHQLRATQPNTLTADEWSLALDYFGGCCAYCGEPLEEFAVKDHFIPVTDENCPGMIALNVVPACRDCNSAKRNYPPQSWAVGRFGLDRANEIISGVHTYFGWLKRRAADGAPR